MKFTKNWDDDKLKNGSELTVGPFKATVFWYESKIHIYVMDSLLDLIYYDMDLAKMAAEQELAHMLRMGLDTILKGE
jgi:hypothetical protein